MVQALDDHYEAAQALEDLPQALRLLGEMNTNVVQVTDLVESMLQKVKTGELTTEYGLSFLEVKYHMLLTYLINLTYVVLRKCSGKQIENDPAIDRLVELRTVLEKIRPIDYKLRYQIDKLVKTAITGTTSASDPNTFKPNPGNLVSQLADDAGDDANGGAGGSDSSADDSDDEDGSEDEKRAAGRSAKKSSSKGKDGAASSAGGKYVPPKLSAVHYDEGDSKAERSRKQLERAKKRALSSSLIQDLKEEYLDTPVEVSAGSRAQQIMSKVQKEKEEYEEAYLTRLPVSKTEKHRQRRLTTLGTLGDEITSFADISALEGRSSGGGGGGEGANKRKRKSTPGKKKKGGKKRKFH